MLPFPHPPHSQDVLTSFPLPLLPALSISLVMFQARLLSTHARLQRYHATSYHSPM